jgi:hypothetical protein
MQIRSDYLIRQVIISIFYNWTLCEIFSNARIAFFTGRREYAGSSEPNK